MGIVQKAELRCRNWVIIEYPINFANEINKLLRHFKSVSHHLFRLYSGLNDLLQYVTTESLTCSQTRVKALQC